MLDADPEAGPGSAGFGIRRAAAEVEEREFGVGACSTGEWGVGMEAGWGARDRIPEGRGRRLGESGESFLERNLEGNGRLLSRGPEAG